MAATASAWNRRATPPVSAVVDAIQCELDLTRAELARVAAERDELASRVAELGDAAKPDGWPADGTYFS